MRKYVLFRVYILPQKINVITESYCDGTQHICIVENIYFVFAFIKIVEYGFLFQGDSDLSI